MKLIAYEEQKVAVFLISMIFNILLTIFKLIDMILQYSNDFFLDVFCSLLQS